MLGGSGYPSHIVDQIGVARPTSATISRTCGAPGWWGPRRGAAHSVRVAYEATASALADLLEALVPA